MNKCIRGIKGIGPQAIEVFEKAGLYTIEQLKNYDGEDINDVLWSAIESIRDGMNKAFCTDYGIRLMSRCISIMYRIRSAHASDFIPVEYMCPLTLDWIQDPVVSVSGHSYSRLAILEWLTKSKTDPLTGAHIPEVSTLYPNIALSKAVDQYRLYFQHFRDMDYC
jgi:U-box domain